MISTIKSLPIEAIAQQFKLVVKGPNPKQIIDGIATLDKAQANHLSFYANIKYRKDFLATQAGVVIIKPEDSDDCPVNAILADNPHLAYARIVEFLNQVELVAGIHPSAVVSDGVKVPSNCSIGPHVTIAEGVELGDYCQIEAGCAIGANSSIGEHCHLHPNVTLYSNVHLGQAVEIHSSTVIGADGFGFANDKGAWIKVPQLGRVIIGNRVELGACCTIDRGALEDTVIKDGVKLDNHVHIAHNCIIGENTAMAAQAGIAGSTQIGKNCAFGGKVGVVGHIKVADNVQVTGGSNVLQALNKSGSYSSGTPLQETSLWHRNHVRFKQLDNLYRQLKKIVKASG